MKYNTEKYKLVMIPVEVKEQLDELIIKLVQKKIDKGEKKLKVTYSTAIKELLDNYNN
jgi:hypothetical protein